MFCDACFGCKPLLYSPCGTPGAAFPTKVCTDFRRRVFRSGPTQGDFKAHASFLYDPRRERCPQRSAAPMKGSRNDPEKDEIENSPKSKSFPLHKGYRHPNARPEEGDCRNIFLLISTVFGTPGGGVPYEDCTNFRAVPFWLPLEGNVREADKRVPPAEQELSNGVRLMWWKTSTSHSASARHLIRLGLRPRHLPLKGKALKGLYK